MKYLHYMPVPSIIYNHNVIEIINENKDIPGEHVFCLLDKECYEQNAGYSNVLYKPNYSIRQFNKDAQNYDFIVIHGLDFSFFDMLKINKVISKKIIWCVWGHDLYVERSCVFNEGVWKSFKSIVKMGLIKLIWIPFVRNFYCICISFAYDKMEIQRLLQTDMRVMQVTYGLGYDFSMVKNIKGQPKKNKSSEINILVGHCAYPFLNHISILERLKIYINENVKIYLPMSYGDADYREKIKKYVETYPLKTQIILDFLPPDKYIQLLDRMDIAIFDYKHQAALGNIYLLLYLEKKLYLDMSGVIAKGLQYEHVTVFDVENIGIQSFEEICSSDYSSKEGMRLSEENLDKKSIIRQWKQLFQKCEHAKAIK